MKFFLDENFPKASAVVLGELGHELLDLRGTEFEGATDEFIFQLAQKENAIFLTTDRDFFHTIPHLYQQHAGVVVIALRQPNRARILDRLQWFLTHFGEKDFQNRVFQLRDATWMAYPPLDKVN